MIVTTLNYNPFYVRQLNVMLESLSRNTDEVITVYLVDFPVKEFLKLKERYPRYIFIYDTTSVLHLNKEKQRGYMCCYASEVLLRELAKNQKPIAWMDTDVIVRKPLKDFWDVKPNSLKILVRNTPKEHVKFNAGVFVFGYSHFTLKFLSEYRNIIRRYNNWYLDQLGLFKLYQKHNSFIDLIQLDKKFNDLGGKEDSFDDDSYIWHAKSSHINHPKFAKESKKYEYS